MMDTIKTIQPLLTLLFSLASVVTIIIAFYKFFSDPDNKASTEIKLIKQNCALTHASIDKNIFLIKENHLKHLESDVSIIKTDLAVLTSTINERLPK